MHRTLLLVSVSIISACAPMSAPTTNEEVVIECSPTDQCCLPPPYRHYGCQHEKPYSI